MKTAQEVARDVIHRMALERDSEVRSQEYGRALVLIAAIPSPPFALPVDAKESVRVSAVVSVWRMSDETVAIRTCPTSDEASVFAKPPYAAAWLALFGVPSKEASK